MTKPKRESQESVEAEGGETQVEVAGAAEVLVEVKAENEVVEMSEDIKSRYEEFIRRIKQGGK